MYAEVIFPACAHWQAPWMSEIQDITHHGSSHPQTAAANRPAPFPVLSCQADTFNRLSDKCQALITLYVVVGFFSILFQERVFGELMYHVFLYFLGGQTRNREVFPYPSSLLLEQHVELFPPHFVWAASELGPKSLHRRFWKTESTS